MATVDERRDRVRSLAWGAGLTVVFLAGLAVRIAKAWSSRYTPDSDFGTVALMAKHIAEGIEFPVFCYGVWYSGSFEQIVSAGLCRLLGTSEFAVLLGTALVGAVILPLVYLWGRDAGGRRAGLMAMLYCLAGPAVFLRYTVFACGAYSIFMVCGILTIWFAVRLACSERTGKPVALRGYVALGAAAGLGWWSQQLIFPFLMVAGVVILLGYGLKILRVGFVAAGVAFFAAGLPWWVWNVTHRWGSFDFAASFEHASLRSGLWSLWVAFGRLIGLRPDNAWGVARLSLMVVVLLAFAWLVVRSRREAWSRALFPSRLAAALLVVFMGVLYAKSRYCLPPTERYLLPMVPALAVMVGVVCDALLTRFRLPVGWIVFVLLLPGSLLGLPSMAKRAASERPDWEIAGRLAEAMPRLGDGVCIGDWGWHWMNFASRERICVACPPKEYYAPNARRGELAERPVYLDDFGQVTDFAAHTRSSFQVTNVAGVTVVYDLAPPSDDWQYVVAPELAAAEDEQGRSCAAAIGDGDLDTGWWSQPGPTNPAVLTVTFADPVDLAGVRFLSPDDREPDRIRIEGRSAASGEWVPLLSPTVATFFFWSGPYAFYDGPQYRQEFRFSSPKGGVSGVRVILSSSNQTCRVHLGEIQFMKAGARPAGALPAVAACEAALRASHVRKAYAPRWLASRLSVRLGGDIDIDAPLAVRRSLYDLAVREPRTPHEIVLKDATGFLADTRDAPCCRAVLKRLGLHWQETPLEAYVLLAVAAPAPDHDSARYATLYWTEAGCMAVGPGKYARRKSQALCERALARQDAATNALADLREAVRLDPQNQQATRALIDRLRADGVADEAGHLAEALADATVPQVPAAVRFANGIELLGVTPGVRTGQAIRLTFYWKCPPGIDAHRVVAQLRFAGTGFRWDDHRALLNDTADDEIRNQSQGRIFAESRSVAIPADAKPGEYRVDLALYDSIKGNRLRPSTGLSTSHRGVTLPLTIPVKP